MKIEANFSQADKGATPMTRDEIMRREGKYILVGDDDNDLFFVTVGDGEGKFVTLALWPESMEVLRDDAFTDIKFTPVDRKLTITL